MSLTFGAIYDRLTSSALAEIRDRVTPPASIVDFGAGCGRLAVPLAELGYRITAVEPSGAMLRQLRSRSANLDIDLVASPMQEYQADRPHDFALCVFTVIAYLLDEQSLAAGMASAARSLAPGGLLLLDVPHPEVFESFDYDSGEIIRHVEIDGEGDTVYDYREDTALRNGDGTTSRYQDHFRIRRWTSEEVLAALDSVGFVRAVDVAARFSGLGADYLLMRRSR